MILKPMSTQHIHTHKNTHFHTHSNPNSVYPGYQWLHASDLRLNGTVKKKHTSEHCLFWALGIGKKPYIFVQLCACMCASKTTHSCVSSWPFRFQLLARLKTSYCSPQQLQVTPHSIDTAVTRWASQIWAPISFMHSCVWLCFTFKRLAPSYP